MAKRLRPWAEEIEALSDSAQRLALLYFHGRGVRKDNAEAVRLWRLAAAQGDANAQFYLGCMFKHGQGVAQEFRSSWVQMKKQRAGKRARGDECSRLLHCISSHCLINSGHGLATQS
jgi:TPR repeat protein